MIHALIFTAAILTLDVGIIGVLWRICNTPQPKEPRARIHRMKPGNYK